MNGWVIVDKPVGMTSTRVVSLVKRLFNTKKAGHGGTLDPFATGVLPIALGEATKTMPYILESSKAYRFRVKWGEGRSTEDLEGEVTEISAHRPTPADIGHILSQFCGEIEQVPPRYSAIHIDGKRAYDLARAGEDFEVPSRRVTIESLTFLEADAETALFDVTCSKGTYIRSLARDMARALGTCGHLIELRRTKAGPFCDKDAILLDSLIEMGHKAVGEGCVLPLQAALDDILAVWRILAAVTTPSGTSTGHRRCGVWDRHVPGTGRS